MFKPVKSMPKFIKAMVPAFQKSGKTVFCLCFAEILMKLEEKTKGKLRRIAMIASESPHDYAEEFDFDAIETESILKANEAIDFAIDSDEYGVLIIDSATEFYKDLLRVWSEFVEENGTKKQKENLKNDTISYYDRGIYNKPWNALVNKIIQGKIHILVTSRKKEVYVKNSDGQLEVDGDKAVVQKDFGYEFSHLFELYRTEDQNIFVTYSGRNKNMENTIDLPNYKEINKEEYLKKFYRLFKPIFDSLGEYEPVEKETASIEKEFNIEILDNRIQNFIDFMLTKHKKDMPAFEKYFEQTFEVPISKVQLSSDVDLKNKVIEELKNKFSKKYGEETIAQILS